MAPTTFMTHNLDFKVTELL